jgi:DNA-binding MarR family transcriptional regulator
VEPAAPTLLLDLFAAHHRSGQLVELAVRDVGVTADEFALLSFLGRSGPATPTAIARALGLYVTTALFRLGKLEEQGLVRRSPNPEDGRSFIVSLTPRGESKWNDGGARLRALLVKIERRLGDPEAVQATVRRLSLAIDAEVAETTAAAPDGCPPRRAGRTRRPRLSARVDAPE